MLTVKWYDSRIIYTHLDSNMAKNLLPKKELQGIWVPRVVFENTKNKLQTEMDKTTSIYVKNLNISSFTITDNTNSEAVKQYSGDENLLVSTRF